MSKSDLLIITPIFYGDGSGAAVYYNILSSYLLKKDLKVSIISDYESGVFDGSYYGLFPAWALKNKRKFMNYILYALQNVMYLFMVFVFIKDRPKTVLIHSSFFNNPGIFKLVFQGLRSIFSNTNFVLDVRDRLMPPKKTSICGKFDNVIACSENVRNYLIKCGVRENIINLIPVIQENLKGIDESCIERFREYGILKDQYILYSGALKEEKGAGLLLKSYVEYVNKTTNPLKLVLIGLLKTNDVEIIDYLKRDDIIYLGKRLREDVLCLVINCGLSVNISPNEGLPRVSLEALALEVPVVLPPNVPEFKTYCEKSVVSTDKPEVLADFMKKRIESGVCTNYPIEKHLPLNVLPLYEKILNVEIK